MALTWSEDWLASRVWTWLEAPGDLGARRVCAAWRWATLAPATTGDTPEAGPATPSLLRLSHLAWPLEGREAVRCWSVRHVATEPLESLRLQVDEAPLEEASSCSSTLRDRRPRPHVIGDILCDLAGAGAAAWVAWILRASPDAAQKGWLRLHRWSPDRCSTASSLMDIEPLTPAVSFEPLKSAAAYGHANVVRLLASARANVRGVDEHECTALHWAADRGHAEACVALLEARADADARDDDDWTPLCLAADEGHVEVCKTLLAARAGVNICDEDSRSPLWWAVWKKHQTLVTLLIENGADMAQADSDGISPGGLLNGRAKH